MLVREEYAHQLKNFKPHTYLTLKKSFQHLGLKKGMVVIVHSSLSSIGWTCGGPVAVVMALMDTITSSGAIIMPTPTPEYSDPSTWKNGWLPREWWEIFRAELPAFDPLTTPSRQAGIIPETFRGFPNVKRTPHPTYSFAVWGRKAKELCSGLSLDNPCGRGSVLEKTYNLHGHVLLIGVENAVNLSLYLAFDRFKKMAKIKDGAPVLVNGERAWKTFYRHETQSSELMNQIVADFAKEFSVQRLTLGFSSMSIMNQRELVDYAVQWLDEKWPVV